MITKEEIVEIGKFQKTHALQGELNALLDVQEDFLADGNALVMNVDGIYVPFYAESVRTKGAESFLVKLKGIDSADAAQQFVNKEVYGLRKDLLNYFDDFEEEFENDMKGYLLIDESLGTIGTIADIDDSTENVLFVVETPTGKNILIPATDAYLVDVDDDNRIIKTNLPEGLVDLN